MARSSAAGRGRRGAGEGEAEGQGDRLEGGAGRDVLVGGAGGDLLLGGPGADRFVLAAGHGPGKAQGLILLDFSRAEGDRIDLRRLDGDPDRKGDQKLRVHRLPGFDGAADEVRVDRSAGFARVEVDLDDDFRVELSLRLDRDVRLHEGDFLL